jgi:hypothetical protein
MHVSPYVFDRRNKFYKETDVMKIVEYLRKKTVCFTLNVRSAAGVYLFLARVMKILLRTEEVAISYVLVVVKY